MKSITCVVVPVRAKPYVKEIPDALPELQAIVGGYIEVLRLTDNLLLLCDEDAKLKGSVGNRRIGEEIIAGQFIVVGDGGETFTSLNKYETAAMLGRFSVPEEISPQEVEDSCKLTFSEW